MGQVRDPLLCCVGLGERLGTVTVSSGPCGPETPDQHVTVSSLGRFPFALDRLRHRRYGSSRSSQPGQPNLVAHDP